jgi:hypothetical protein
VFEWHNIIMQWKNINAFKILCFQQDNGKHLHVLLVFIKISVKKYEYEYGQSISSDGFAQIAH